LKIDLRGNFLDLAKLLLVLVQLAFWGVVICFAILATNFPASWADAIRGTMQ
jgi:hypothetical protein